MIIIRKRDPKKRRVRFRRVRFRCDYCRSSFIAEQDEYKAEKLPISRSVYYIATCPVCGKETIKIPLL